MQIAIITTLNNNLISAKLKPLLNLEQIEQIYFVTDKPGPSFHKVRYIIPSSIVMRSIFHKSLSKFILLMNICINQNPSLIMSYNILPHGYSAFIVGKLFRRKIYQHLIGGFSDVRTEYQTSDNSLVRKFPFLAMLFTQINKFVVRKSDLIFVPGQATKKSLIEELSIPETKVVVLHSTIDTDFFHPSNQKKIYDIVVVSALEIRKRIELFLRVVEILRKTYPQVNALILGKGSLKSNLIKLSEDMNLDKNVQFLDFQEDVRRYYWQSKIFVLTSVFEGLSCSAMEAMASGLPVVVPNVGDMNEIAVNEETGFLIDDKDNPIAYADKILQLLKNNDLREKCSRNAVALIRNQHSTKSAETKWHDVFERLSL